MSREAMKGSICLSDIPEKYITTGKDGKKYVCVIFDKMMDAGNDRYGNTHDMKISKRYDDNDPFQYKIGGFRPMGHKTEPKVFKSTNRI